MQNTSPLPPWMFKLEGTIQGFCGKDRDKPKSILLEVEQERIPIRLPRERRSQLRQHLQPGDRVCCVGRSQVDFTTGIVKLEAYQLFSLPFIHGDSPILSPVQFTTAQSSTSSSGLAVKSNAQTPASKGPLAKIILCRKSGCQKKGGKVLMETLEQILREQQLLEKVKIQYSGCQKRCSTAPSLTIMPGKHRYDRLTKKKLSSIIQKHFGDRNS